MDYRVGLLGLRYQEFILFEYDSLFEDFKFEDFDIFNHTNLEFITLSTEKSGSILNYDELMNNYTNENILEVVYFFIDEKTGLYKVFYKSMYNSYSYSNKPSISLRKSSYTTYQWELLCDVFGIPNNVTSFDTELDNIQTFI